MRERLRSSGRAQLWEWRIAPGLSIAEEASADVEEEIVTAIRGVVTVEASGETYRLRRGATLALPPGGVRRFANGAKSNARLLRFQVGK